MKNFKMNEWQKAVTLEFASNPQDISRSTARRYNVAWSSMWDQKRRLELGLIKYEDALQKPNILLFDIETAPILAHVWGIWNNNVGLNQIQEDWYMLSYAAKWLGEDTIYSDCLPNYDSFKEEPENDYFIIRSLWKMLDEADIVIGHNLRKFDDRKFRARCLYHGIPEPSSYRMIDTLKIAKKSFALTSNKLDFLATTLKLPNKVTHEGHTLWVKCMAGDLEAWDIMMEYNEYDVVLLEDVYMKIRHWDDTHPNVAVYYNDKLRRCPVCGSDDLTVQGTAKTNLSEYTEYRCDCCTKVSRTGNNLLDKEKRATLNRNVVR